MEMSEELQALLRSNSPENSLLAIQLMQGTLECSKTEAIQSIFDYHWKEELFTLKLLLGPIELSYTLEYTDDGGLTGLIWYDIDLEFRMLNLNTVIAKDILMSNNVSGEEASEYLNDHEELIRTHFEQQLPIILEHLNY